METRANYVLIGLFTLAVIAGAFGFVLWFKNVSSTKLRTPLRMPPMKPPTQSPTSLMRLRTPSLILPIASTKTRTGKINAIWKTGKMSCDMSIMRLVVKLILVTNE